MHGEAARLTALSPLFAEYVRTNCAAARGAREARPVNPAEVVDATLIHRRMRVLKPPLTKGEKEKRNPYEQESREKPSYAVSSKLFRGTSAEQIPNEDDQSCEIEERVALVMTIAAPDHERDKHYKWQRTGHERNGSPAVHVCAPFYRQCFPRPCAAPSGVASIRSSRWPLRSPAQKQRSPPSQRKGRMGTAHQV
jgi:hypothetical protein